LSRDLGTGLSKAQALMQRYVKVSRYHLNPDEVVVRNVVRGLARNWVRHGRFYCPCREVSGSPGADRKNICPCTTHKQDIARDGACECGLYVSSSYLEALASQQQGTAKSSTGRKVHGTEDWKQRH